MKKSFLILSLVSVIICLGALGCSKSKKAEVAVVVDPIASGIEMAQALIQEGDAANGIKTLEELNQQYPNQEEILEALAFAHTNQNDHLEAAFYFESIANLDNTQSSLLLQAARSYEEEKVHESAIRCYNRYLDAHPADGKAWKAYAKVLIKKEDYDQALQAYTRALSNENGKPTPFEVISIGKLYYKKGDLAQANDWYELGKSSAESRPFALLGQAEIRLNQNNIQDAETLLTSLIQEYPTFKTQSPYIHLSKKLQSAKAKRAAQLAEEAKLAAQAKAAAEAKALAEAKAAAEAQAATEIQVASETQSTTETQATTATVAENSATTSLEAPAQTEIAATHTQNVSANETNAALQVANTSSSSAETENLIHINTSTSIQATATQPKIVNAATYVSEADVALQNHDTDKAIRLYWKAVEAEPKSEKSWIALSQAYLNLQDSSHAQSTALEAMRVNPYSEIAAINYVSVLNPNTNRTEYFSEINRLKKQFPNSAPIVIEISKSYEQKLNNPRNAYYTYLQFLQNNPTHPQKTTLETEAKRLYHQLNPANTSSTSTTK